MDRFRFSDNANADHPLGQPSPRAKMLSAAGQRAGSGLRRLTSRETVHDMDWIVENDHAVAARTGSFAKIRQGRLRAVTSIGL